MSQNNLYKGFEVELFTGTLNSHIGLSAEIETNKLVIISEFLDPKILPKKPEIIDPNNGKKIIKYSKSILPF